MGVPKKSQGKTQRRVKTLDARDFCVYASLIIARVEYPRCKKEHFKRPNWLSFIFCLQIKFTTVLRYKVELLKQNTLAKS